MGNGSNQNYTGLRLTYYPPVPPDSEIEPGQIRCGEHVDYNSITFLILDPIGGLQVKPIDSKTIIHAVTPLKLNYIIWSHLKSGLYTVSFTHNITLCSRIYMNSVQNTLFRCVPMSYIMRLMYTT